MKNRFRTDDQRKAAFANMFGRTGGKRSRVNIKDVKNFEVRDFKLKATEKIQFGKIKQETFKMPPTSYTMPDPHVFKGKSLTSEDKSRPPPSIARSFITINNLAFNEMTNPDEMSKNNIAEFMSDVQLKKAYSSQNPITTLDKFIESHTEEEVFKLLNLSTEDVGFDNSFLELDTPLGKDAPAVNFAAYKYFGEKAFDVRTNTFGDLEEKVYVLRPEYRKKTMVKAFEDARDGGVNARVKVRPGQSGTLVFETGVDDTPTPEGEAPEIKPKGIVVEGGLYQTKQNVYTSDDQATAEGVQPLSPLVSKAKTKPRIIPEKPRGLPTFKKEKIPTTFYYEVDQPLLDIDRQVLDLEEVKDATDPSKGKFVYKKKGKLSKGDQKKLNAKELKGLQTPEFIREQEQEKIAMEKAEKVAAELVAEQAKKEKEIVEVEGEKISPDILIKEKEKRVEAEKVKAEKEAEIEPFEKALADVPEEVEKPKGIRAKVKAKRVATKEKKQKLRKEIDTEIAQLEKEIVAEKAKEALTPTEKRELEKLAALRIKKRRVKPEEEKPPAPRPSKVPITKRKPAERPKPVIKKPREKSPAEKVRSARRLEKVMREKDKQLRKESKVRTKASTAEVKKKFREEVKALKVNFKGEDLKRRLDNLALRYEAGKRKGFASDEETKKFAINQTKKNINVEIRKLSKKSRPTTAEIQLLGKLRKFKVTLNAGKKNEV